MPPTIPITVLTGFLGAGKTTFLNALLCDPAFADTAVLINEFGEVAIDHDLVANFDGKVVLTTTGCLCCRASSDIKQSLFDLWNRYGAGEIRPFKRVIVETTGLADPVPIVSTLISRPGEGAIDTTVAQQFALSAVITLFDIVTGSVSLDNHFEALKQVALADIIVLTKSDLAQDPASRHNIEGDRERLESINPGVLVLDRQMDWPRIREELLRPKTYDLRERSEDASAWLRAEAIVGRALHAHDHHDVNRHGDGIRAHSLIVDEPLSPAIFRFFLDALKLSAGQNLLRMKGLFALADDPDRPVIVHGVQHLVHPVQRLEHWPGSDKRTRIVLIGRDLNVEAMRTILTAGNS